jgi:hypothetical protein
MITIPTSGIDAMLKGWDPSKDGCGPFEFDDIEAGPPLTSIDDLKRAPEILNNPEKLYKKPGYNQLNSAFRPGTRTVAHIIDDQH